MESRHASRVSASARRKYISNSDILDEFGVKIGLCVSCTKDMGQDKFRFRVLESALSTLRKPLSKG